MDAVRRIGMALSSRPGTQTNVLTICSNKYEVCSFGRSRVAANILAEDRFSVSQTVVGDEDF